MHLLAHATRHELEIASIDIRYSLGKRRLGDWAVKEDLATDAPDKVFTGPASNIHGQRHKPHTSCIPLCNSLSGYICPRQVTRKLFSVWRSKKR